jgi:hypothetical protein
MYYCTRSKCKARWDEAFGVNDAGKKENTNGKSQTQKGSRELSPDDELLQVGEW